MTTPSESRSFGILPAAGTSRRMGSPKLLLPWRNHTVWEEVLSHWLGAVTQLFVVLRRDDEALQRICESYQVTVVLPAVPPPDMKASVCAALDTIAAEYAPGDDDCWLLAPADTPNLSSAVIRQVVQAYRRRPGHAIVASYRGHKGHPLCCPWSLAAEVKKLEPTEGIRDLARRFSIEMLETDDESVCQDLDTPADYAAQRAQAEHPS